MELNFVEKKVISSVVEDLQANPALVGEIEETALTQVDPFDFNEAIRTVIRVRGLSAFPRFKDVLESNPKGIGMGAGDFVFGDALFSLLEIGVTAGAGYLGAKLLADSQEDMLGDKLAFEERMLNKDRALEERNTAAMEEYNRLIKEANNKKKSTPSPNYKGSGREESTETDDSLPTWVMPAAIGAGALAVGYIALK